MRPDDQLLRQLRAGERVELIDPLEQVIVEVSAALCATDNFNDDNYQRAGQHLNVEGIFELSTLIGYYAPLALQLRLFRVVAPD